MDNAAFTVLGSWERFPIAALRDPIATLWRLSEAMHGLPLGTDATAVESVIRDLLMTAAECDTIERIGREAAERTES